MRGSAVWLAIALTGCTAAGVAPPGPASVAATVARGVLQQRLLLTGEIDAAASVELSGPRTQDWNLAIRWLAEDGAEVRRGDRVIGFDTAAAIEAIRERELAVIEAENHLVEQAATDEVASDDKSFEVETQRIAVAKAKLDIGVPVHLLSRREARDFELALARAEVALASANADADAAVRGAKLEAEVGRIALAKAERSLQAAQAQLGGLELVAERDGIFIVSSHPWEGRKLRVGDNVWPGLPVGRLPDLSRLVVRARLDDVDDGRVRAGQRVTCVVDAWPERPLPGHVVAVSPVAHEVAHQSTRRYFTVDIELEGGAPAELRPGLSVRVEVDVRTTEDALLVPRAAMILGGDTARVKLANGDTAEVVVDACSAQQCAVISGLDEGAAVAVEAEGA